MSEEGAAVAAELHQYAKDYGCTPYQALQDEHFEFNAAVMRGYYKARQVARDRASAAAGKGAIEIPDEEETD